MDMDIIEENEQQYELAKLAGKRPATLPVDEAHPFELETISTGYSGEAVSYDICVRLETHYPQGDVLLNDTFRLYRNAKH